MLFRSTRRVAAGRNCRARSRRAERPRLRWLPPTPRRRPSSVPQALGCAYQTFNIEYLAAADVKVDGTAVTVTASRMQPTGIPATFKVHSIAVEWNVVHQRGARHGDGHPHVPDPLSRTTRRSRCRPPSLGPVPVPVTRPALALGNREDHSWPGDPRRRSAPSLACSTAHRRICRPTPRCSPAATLGSVFAYPTKVGLAAAQSGGNVGVTATLDAMPGIVPLSLDRRTHDRRAHHHGQRCRRVPLRLAPPRTPLPTPRCRSPPSRARSARPPPRRLS